MAVKNGYSPRKKGTPGRRNGRQEKGYRGHSSNHHAVAGRGEPAPNRTGAEAEPTNGEQVSTMGSGSRAIEWRTAAPRRVAGLVSQNHARGPASPKCLNRGELPSSSGEVGQRKSGNTSDLPTAARERL